MRARIFAPSVAGSIPSTRKVPPLTGLIHEIMRMVEVLPAPFGPRKPNDSPRAMVKSTPSTATKSPKRFCRLCASTMGDSPGAPSVPGRGAPSGWGGVGASVVGEKYDGTVSQRYRVLAAADPARYPDSLATVRAPGEATQMATTAAGRSFPDGFTWGTATAAHQIEGGNTNNDWWEFEHAPGSACAESSGDGCDSWNRWEEDADLVAGLGFDNYRFSVEWSRIEPAPGVISRAALG